MKSTILIILVAWGLLVPQAAMASSRILLPEDIGASEATFAFAKGTKAVVTVTARVDQECWDQDCDPHLYHSTNILNQFSLHDREVYYAGGQVPVYCGETHGIFLRSPILAPCQIMVTPELVCEVWHRDEDCTRATTNYRVNLTIQ